MYIRFTVLILLLLNACCTISPKGRTHRPPSLCSHQKLVVVDNSLSADYKQAARAAVDFWNAQTGRELLKYAGSANLTDDIYSNRFIALRPIDEEYAKSIDHAVYGRTHSFYSRYEDNYSCIHGAEIRLNATKMSRPATYFVIYHELGHAIGLHHSIEPKTLMYPLTFKDSRIQLGNDTKKDLVNLYPNLGEDNAL